jgi:predicted Kef-type K+ transport protein
MLSVPMLVSHNFLEDLAFVLSVAAVTTVIFRAMRQPVVVGYLVAGMLVGPYLSFPLFADIDRIRQLSEFGVILLMFALGLEFSVRKLVQLAPSAGFIMVVKVGLLMWLGYMVGRVFGWTELEGIFAGAVLAISSTTIIAKAFAEEQVGESLSELVFGVALFEYIAAVISIVERLISSRQMVAAPAVEEVVGVAGIGPLVQVRIPDGSGTVGMSLADLNLHAVTGAMVVAIERGGHGLIVPGGTEVLRAGDTLALVGPTDAISPARVLLSAAPAPAAQPAVATSGGLNG